MNNSLAKKDYLVVFLLSWTGSTFLRLTYLLYQFIDFKKFIYILCLPIPQLLLLLLFIICNEFCKDCKAKSFISVETCLFWFESVLVDILICSSQRSGEDLTSTTDLFSVKSNEGWRWCPTPPRSGISSACFPSCFFQFVASWLQIFALFDLRFEFLVEICLYCQLDMSRN